MRQNTTTRASSAHIEPAAIQAAIERRIASLELARADAAKLRDVTPADVAAKHFYEGRLQALDVALAELRKLIQDVRRVEGYALILSELHEQAGKVQS